MNLQPLPRLQPRNKLYRAQSCGSSEVRSSRASRRPFPALQRCLVTPLCPRVRDFEIFCRILVFVAFANYCFLIGRTSYYPRIFTRVCNYACVLHFRIIIGSSAAPCNSTAPQFEKLLSVCRKPGRKSHVSIIDIKRGHLLH